MAAKRKFAKKPRILIPLTPARKRKVLQSLRELNAKIQEIQTTLIHGDFVGSS
jgi:hypothetical protein